MHHYIYIYASPLPCPPIFSCLANQPTCNSLTVKIKGRGICFFGCPFQVFPKSTSESWGKNCLMGTTYQIEVLHPLQPQTNDICNSYKYQFANIVNDPSQVSGRGVQIGSPATKIRPKQHWKELWLSRSWPEGTGGQPQQCPLRYNASARVKHVKMAFEEANIVSPNGSTKTNRIGKTRVKTHVPCRSCWYFAKSSAVMGPTLLQKRCPWYRTWSKWDKISPRISWKSVPGAITNPKHEWVPVWHRICERKQFAELLTISWWLQMELQANKLTNTVVQPWNWLRRREEVLHTAEHRNWSTRYDFVTLREYSAKAAPKRLNYLEWRHAIAAMDIFQVHFNFNKTASGMSWSDDRAFPLALVAGTGADSRVKIPQSLL